MDLCTHVEAPSKEGEPGSGERCKDVVRPGEGESAEDTVSGAASGSCKDKILDMAKGFEPRRWFYYLFSISLSLSLFHVLMCFFCIVLLFSALLSVSYVDVLLRDRAPIYNTWRIGWCLRRILENPFSILLSAP